MLGDGKRNRVGAIRRNDEIYALWEGGRSKEELETMYPGASSRAIASAIEQRRARDDLPVGNAIDEIEEYRRVNRNLTRVGRDGVARDHRAKPIGSTCREGGCRDPRQTGIAWCAFHAPIKRFPPRDVVCGEVSSK